MLRILNSVPNSPPVTVLQLQLKNETGIAYMLRSDRKRSLQYCTMAYFNGMSPPAEN